MQIGIKNIRKKELIKPAKKLDGIYKETEELIAIMAKIKINRQKVKALKYMLMLYFNVNYKVLFIEH